ncbi:ThrRS/AlaRS common domain-containing protein [Mycena floridula]|nr:ThrRS/AlaRS common domain-containing protein [Mycena floridula]
MAPPSTLTTPSDYHKIIDPLIKVPSEGIVPVGLLACQRDPLLRELDTTVISAVVFQPAPTPASKKGNKAVLAPKIPDVPILQVILQDTCIFPEGGGQPTDIGTISTAQNNVWEVLQCQRHGGHAVHFVRVPDGDTDAALAAFSPGHKVVVSLGPAGWERRLDHMSMHTSQHLLSALLETRLNLPTLSWSLTAFPAPCYVELPRSMTLEQITEIQNEANKLVFEGKRVHVEVEALDLTQSEPAPKLEGGRSVGRGLPEDYSGGVKRIVIIDNVDRNPCCGTHLPSLHNLQLFLLPHTEALSRSSTTSVRLYFLCGPRLIHHLASTHQLLTSTASLLSCGAPLVTERVTQVVTERKQADKRVEDLELELAKYIAADLLDKIKAAEGIFIKHIHRNDVSSNPLGFISSIGLVLADLCSQLPESPRYLIVISSSPHAQTTSTVSVICAFGSELKQTKEAGDALKTRLGIKGGGQKQWSGKLVGVWKHDLLVEDALQSLGYS